MVSEDRFITRQAAADAIGCTVRTVYKRWPRGAPLRESDLPLLASLIKEKPELRARRREAALKWWAERKAGAR